MLNSLNVAQSGLSASKIAVENVSNNISNENTPGYKKRVVQLSELELIDGRMTGRGVRADEVYRITSQYLYDNMVNENSKTNYLSEVSSMIGNIEKMFQEGEDSGFSSDFNRFLQSVENLRSNPNSEIYKNTFKTQGRVLVDSLQNLYANIEKQENLTRTSLETNVDTINEIIKEIGDVNSQMGQYIVASNDLLDKRDSLEKELSKYVDIEVDRSNDEYSLKIGGVVAVRFNTNIREVNLVEKKIAQIDRFSTNPPAGAPIGWKPENAIEEKFGTLQTGDKVTYKLNNEFSVSVEIGSNQYTDSEGNSYSIDFDNDGTSDTVDETNYVRALASAINHNSDISEKVVAYNGNYELDAAGNRVDNFTSDDFLLVEARYSGEEGKFSGRISVKKAAGNPTENGTLFKNDYQSVEGSNRVSLAIYDKEVNTNSGVIKAQTENLTTNAIGNKIIDYKEKLDAFAATISDIYDKYIKVGTDDYKFGHIASDEYNGTENIKHLNLFSGSDVKSLKFNDSAVNDLKQVDLDYMATLQWKKNIEFGGFGQNVESKNATSFSEFFQEIRINISSDKENNDFLLEAQVTVEQSLQVTYDKLTKVDSDEEMINLIKFQAAYTANAKIITVVDQMLDTILGIR